MPEVVSTRLVIGLEIHVELAARSKLFSRAANPAHPDFFDADPNTLIDPVVVALPGTLPVLNRRAVELAMLVGLALDCRIAQTTHWDRKNYFYPDLPKGYQISQYDLPLCYDGELKIELEDGTTHRVGIIRAHLEEDAGKLGHELPGGHPYEGSLVDFNRAGTPLLEIVTRPDLHTSDQAVTFCQELRNICRFVGASEGDMQRGHMRFEPNVNVIIETDDGRIHATPIVEIKNLNSFRAVKLAIDYEYGRQVEQWGRDGVVKGPGTKSTRGWDDEREITVLQREKEDEQDYRYFPDPDLPPLVIEEHWRDEVAAKLPELPAARRKRYRDEFDLPAKDAAALTLDRATCEFYEQCVRETYGLEADHGPVAHPGFACAKLLLNTGARYANDRGCGVHELGITPKQIAQIVSLRDDDRIGSSAADELFALLCDRNDDAHVVAEERGLLQVSDMGKLEQWIEQACAAEPKSAEDFAAGKDAAAGRLIGAVMKLSGGQADAKMVREMLVEKLCR